MVTRPDDISRDVGKFTRDRWRFLWDRVFRLDAILGNLELSATEPSRPPLRHFLPVDWHLACLPSRATLATNRWKYSHKEVRVKSDDSYEVVTGGITGTTSTDYAINLFEMGNDGLSIEAGGIDVEGEDFPAGFSLQPVGNEDGSETLAPVVVMFRTRNSDDGVLRYVFQSGNHVDGTCTVGAASLSDPLRIKNTATDVTVDADQYDLVLVDATSAAVTITLAAAATQSSNRSITVKKTDSSGNAVTIDGNGAELIDGAATQSLASQYNFKTMASDGTAWHVIGSG